MHACMCLTVSFSALRRTPIECCQRANYAYTRTHSYTCASVRALMLSSSSRSSSSVVVVYALLRICQDIHPPGLIVRERSQFFFFFFIFGLYGQKGQALVCADLVRMWTTFVRSSYTSLRRANNQAGQEIGDKHHHLSNNNTTAAEAEAANWVCFWSSFALRKEAVSVRIRQSNKKVILRSGNRENRSHW